MDVEKEVCAANRRIRRQIDQSAREALNRMDARWPSLTQPVVEPPANVAEAYGQWLRGLHDAIVALAEGVARGFTAVDRAAPPHSGGLRK
jgi:hypothetical protein